MSKTRVIILAAGKGTRMKSDIPKPLISVSGEPMITRLIRSVKGSGVDVCPVVVVAPWSKSMFEAVLKNHVEYAVQQEQLGTGNAVKSAREVVADADRVIVLYGDHPFLRPEVIQEIAGLQSSNPTAFVMLTATVPNFVGEFETFVKWGRILRDRTGHVTAIREAKDATPEELLVTEVNPAIFAFPAPWAWEHLDLVKNANASGEYYLTDLVAEAMNSGVPIVTANADPFDVIGINSPEELRRAEAIHHD